ncbi:hypothetical protein JCM11491_002009 [Sporobolomyces phaffii]
MLTSTHNRTLDGLPLPLTKLTLAADCVEESTRNFIAQFKSTLESLTLITNEDEDPWDDPPSIFTSPFPALTHFTVAGTCLRYMSTDPEMTPSLRHLIVRPGLEWARELAQFLADDFISDFPNLVSIDLIPIDVYGVGIWLAQDKPSRLPDAPWPHLMYEDTLAFDTVLRQLGLARGRHSYDAILAPDEGAELAWRQTTPIGATEHVARREGPVKALFKFLLEHNERVITTEDSPGRTALRKALLPAQRLLRVSQTAGPQIGREGDDCPIEATCESGSRFLDRAVAEAHVEWIDALVESLRGAQLLKDLQED